MKKKNIDSHQSDRILAPYLLIVALKLQPKLREQGLNCLNKVLSMVPIELEIFSWVLSTYGRMWA